MKKRAGPGHAAFDQVWQYYFGGMFSQLDNWAGFGGHPSSEEFRSILSGYANSTCRFGGDKVLAIRRIFTSKDFTWQVDVARDTMFGSFVRVPYHWAFDPPQVSELVDWSMLKWYSLSVRQGRAFMRPLTYIFTGSDDDRNAMRALCNTTSPLVYSSRNNPASMLIYPLSYFSHALAVKGWEQNWLVGGGWSAMTGFDHVPLTFVPTWPLPTQSDSFLIPVDFAVDITWKPNLTKNRMVNAVAMLTGSYGGEYFDDVYTEPHANVVTKSHVDLNF
jgi:hypothetical protein